MTLTEVLQALLDGKSLTHSDWEDGESISLRSDGFVGESGNMAYPDDLFYYPQGVSTVEHDAAWAVKQLLNGKEITSPEWGDTLALRNKGGVVVNWNEYNEEDTYSVV